MDHPILDLLEDILPFLSLMTYISTTDNNDSGRNPCEMKIVKHLASNAKVRPTLYVGLYFKCSEQIPSLLCRP